MEQQRIILKKLREQNRLTLDEAARKLGRSKGWLSEIENNRGRSVLRPREYKRIYDLYSGDDYKKLFGVWVKSSSPKSQVNQKVCFDGAIYKFLRCHKAKITIEEASRRLNLSKGFLSKIENGRASIDNDLKEKILNLYGYKLSS